MTTLVQLFMTVMHIAKQQEEYERAQEKINATRVPQKVRK